MATLSQLPDEFLALCRSVTAKRARIVIDHILEHGYITTQELKEQYGYNHPPRAARDVREHGIPLHTFSVTGQDGRTIAAYKFGDPRNARFRKLSGRTGLSKALWASPENYSHVAMKQVRRIDLIWQGEEIEVYEQLKAQSTQFEKEIPQFVKKIIEKALKKG